MPFLNYFFGVIYNSKYFFGFCTFLGKSLYFYKDKSACMAYTYVLQGLKIQFCLRPCLMTGLGKILEA